MDLAVEEVVMVVWDVSKSGGGSWPGDGDEVAV